MNKNSRIGVVTALVIMVGVVLAIKQTNRQSVTDGKGACCPQIPNLATFPIPNNVQSNPAPASLPATPAPAPSETKPLPRLVDLDRKSTRLNSSYLVISYAVFCLQTINMLLRHGVRRCFAYATSGDIPQARAL